MGDAEACDYCEGSPDACDVCLVPVHEVECPQQTRRVEITDWSGDSGAVTVFCSRACLRAATEREAEESPDGMHVDGRSQERLENGVLSSGSVT